MTKTKKVKNKNRNKKKRSILLRKKRWVKTLSKNNKKKLVNKYNNTLYNIYNTIKKYTGSPGGEKLIYRKQRSMKT